MRQLIAQEGRLDDFLLASRGLMARAGVGGNRATLSAAARHGIDLSGFRPRPITAGDYRGFDLVLCLDRLTRDRLRALSLARGGHKVHLLLDFAPWIGTDEVPDPAHGGEEAFDDVFDLLKLAARGLLEVIDQTNLELAVCEPATERRKVSSGT